MRDTLKSIETTNALGALFNAYMRGLSTPAIMCDPCYTTMAEVKEFAEGTQKPKVRKHYKHSIRNYFALTVLRNSLRHIHDHVVRAVTELESFFAEYGADFQGYAADKRVKSLLENGSDNDEESKTDWYRDNEADEKEEWKVVRKTDPESLKHYTLHNEMGWHFGSEGAGRGEYIGTSTPHDFEPYSTLVANQSAFSFRRFLEHFAADGKTPEISMLQSDGTLTPMSLGDQIEREIKKDMQGEEVVLYFSIALGLCAMLRERYQTMQHEDLAAWQTMHGLLLRVRDLDFPADFLRAQADAEEARTRPTPDATAAPAPASPLPVNGAIYQTTNYDMFHLLPENRPVDMNHVRKLVTLIGQNNLLYAKPIEVTAAMAVIDGQHRLAAARELGLPVYYKIGAYPQVL